MGMVGSSRDSSEQCGGLTNYDGAVYDAIPIATANNFQQSYAILADMMTRSEGAIEWSRIHREKPQALFRACSVHALPRQVPHGRPAK